MVLGCGAMSAVLPPTAPKSTGPGCIDDLGEIRRPQSCCIPDTEQPVGSGSTRAFVVGPTFLGLGLRPGSLAAPLLRVAVQVGVQEDERECGRANVSEDESASFGFGD